MIMTLNMYQNFAAKTAIYGEGVEKIVRFGCSEGAMKALNLSYATLGLAAEAGELANDYKKYLRGDDFVGQVDAWGCMTKSQVAMSPERRDKMIGELGGVLWYAAAVARELGVSLSEVGVRNIEALEKRAEKGKIHGDGSDR